MPFTLALLSDLHFGNRPSIAKRRGDLAAVLLQRAVARLNRFLRPDLVLILGDLVDEPLADRATADLKTLRSILDRLDCPWLILRGNHDPQAADFYQVMPRPEPVHDIGPVRVLCFDDPETPGYNAERSEQDLSRLRAARQDGFSGTVISVQHVPLMPPGHPCHYGFTNASEVLAAGDAGGVDLFLAGHVHENSGLVARGRAQHVTVEALCETPHAFTLLHLDNPEDRGAIRIERQTLAMPEAYGLVDLHTHTHYAYCSEDIHLGTTPAIARAMGLRQMAFTEHSGHLYFSAQDYGGRMPETGLAGADPAAERVHAYFEEASRTAPQVLLGMEIDVDYQGRLVIRPEHRAELAFQVGAVHFLPPAARQDTPLATAAFKQMTTALCESGIHSLAHPFRIFRRTRLTKPPGLNAWLVKLLQRTGVAAEINFHTNEPDPTFVQMCIESGVKLSFGSDTHALWEVGEFFPHLQLLSRLGHTGDPTPLLLSPPEVAVPV